MSDWMPPKGRRSVTVGHSLTRALNARKLKGAAPAPKALHLKDFHSFRCALPPSVDPGERGKIVVKKISDSMTNVIVERPSTQGEPHQWTGSETPAKEYDCVLIYDEVSDTYTLEKLDSQMTLTHQHRPIPLESTPTPTPAPPASSSSTSSVSSRRQTQTFKYEDELERELVAAVEAEPDEDADAIGEDDDEDDDFDEIIAKVVSEPTPVKKGKGKMRVKEEIPTVEITPPAPAPAPKQKPPPKPKQKPPRAVKTLPRPPVPVPPSPTPAPAPTASRVAVPAPTPSHVAVPAPTPTVQKPPRPTTSSLPPRPAGLPPRPITTPVPVPAPAPPAAPPARMPAAPGPRAKVPLPRKKPKREPDPPIDPAQLYVQRDFVVAPIAETEVLEFGRPAKRARASPPPVAPMMSGLALPSASSGGFSLPAAPVVVSAFAEPDDPGHETGSESEEEWDEVDPVAAANMNPEDDFDIFGDALGDGDADADADAREDIDLNDLERELNLQMDDEEEEEEDFLVGVVEEAPVSRGPPMSFSDLAVAGVGLGVDSDDEFSSSEDDSEDD
ncbi:hypothetical protein H0H81_012430 [Sphagnurus paluster]|uniref:Transcription elongation factor Eaf N-terminal domain-containing protein n=1 Tax=Sphagnurus paluster TaxID=117069 RepID=A0A9P7FTK7_9AGAR|nr:hypothetical protein H0H81_012430 [Sphagnurus paluster]